MCKTGLKKKNKTTKAKGSGGGEKERKEGRKGERRRKEGRKELGTRVLIHTCDTTYQCVLHLFSWEKYTKENDYLYSIVL